MVRNGVVLIKTALIAAVKKIKIKIKRRRRRRRIKKKRKRSHIDHTTIDHMIVPRSIT
jgi:uncharacterized membrane protein YciS (DUF1049 family)